MKKNGILNSKISSVLSNLRHTDRIVIGDAGLPVPNNVQEIDISLKLGVPSFIDVLTEIEKDMKIEKIVLADEIKTGNLSQLEAINDKLGMADEAVEFVTHEEFKKLTADAKVIIRTGEETPYSNIILQSDVIF